MVSIPSGFAINTAVAGDRTTAAGFRKVLVALFKQSVAGVPTAGVLPGPGTPLDVLPHATLMQYTVKAGFAVTVRTSQGAYLVGTIADVTVTTTAADATNPRIDRIYIVQPDPELGEAGVARIDVVNGTPSATPAVPALPTGALELGQKTVGAGVSNTTTGAAITAKGVKTTLNVDTTAVAYSSLTGIPTTFTPASHTHLASALSASEQLLLSVGEINGKKITVSQTAPVGPAVGDVWIDY